MRSAQSRYRPRKPEIKNPDFYRQGALSAHSRFDRARPVPLPQLATARRDKDTDPNNEQRHRKRVIKGVSVPASALVSQ